MDPYKLSQQAHKQVVLSHVPGRQMQAAHTGTLVTTRHCTSLLCVLLSGNRKTYQHAERDCNRKSSKSAKERGSAQRDNHIGPNQQLSRRIFPNILGVIFPRYPGIPAQAPRATPLMFPIQSEHRYLRVTHLTQR